MPKIIKTNKPNKRPKKSIEIYIISSLKGVVLTLLGLFIVSLLMMKNSSFTMFTKVFIYFSISSGAFLSGYLSYKNLKNKGSLNGLLSSLLYTVPFFIINVICLKFQVSSSLFLCVPLIIISGIIGGIVSANK